MCILCTQLTCTTDISGFSVIMLLFSKQYQHICSCWVLPLANNLSGNVAFNENMIGKNIWMPIYVAAIFKHIAMLISSTVSCPRPTPCTISILVAWPTSSSAPLSAPSPFLSLFQGSFQRHIYPYAQFPGPALCLSTLMSSPISCPIPSTFSSYIPSLMSGPMSSPSYFSKPLL